MKPENFGFAAFLIYVGLMLTALVGWFVNLIDVINLATANSPLTTLFIVKLVGIFIAPLGIIMGLFF